MKTGAGGLAGPRARAGVLPGAHPACEGVGRRVFSAGGAPERAAVHEGLATLPRGAGERSSFGDCFFSKQGKKIITLAMPAPLTAWCKSYYYSQRD